MNLSPLELVFLIPLITAVGWFVITNLFMGGLMDGDADVEAGAGLEVEAGARLAIMVCNN